MANSLTTNYFRLHNANQFRESISETANSIYYVFAGRHTEYSGGDDAVDPVHQTTFDVDIDVYKKMIFGKKVTASDVKIMVQRHNWISNTVYQPYRSNTDLSNSNFFVVTDATTSYHVFKVLDNNGGASSTIEPDLNDTSADDEYYSTSDGYVWKYMYSIDQSSFDKFATADYIPVVPNANVQGNAVSGAIDVIVVDYKGSNYNSYLSNTFISSDLAIGGDPTRYSIANNASSSNNYYLNCYLYIKQGTGMGQIKKIIDYVVLGNQKTVTLESQFNVAPDITSVYEITPYVLIVGDGNGAIARAIVNSNSSNCISSIEIINRGQGYTFAVASVGGNTGGVSNNASLNVVIGPKGGHGSDSEAELYGSSIGMSVTFANNESGNIPVSNDYRTIGIIRDPLFSSVELTVGNVTGLFVDNELLIQNTTNARGYISQTTTTSISIANVSGIFEDGYTVVGQSSGSSANVVSFQINGQAKSFDTFDARHKFTYTAGAGTFQEDEKVYQSDLILSNAYFHSNDANFIYLTDLRGTLDSGNTLFGANSSADADLLVYYPPDIVEGSGKVLYIENTDPITRSNSQSETIKLILKF